MSVTYDPKKRDIPFTERGLDFKDAAAVFAGAHFETEDLRIDDGEKRMICFGMLHG